MDEVNQGNLVVKLDVSRLTLSSPATVAGSSRSSKAKSLSLRSIW